ncbi:hypothetical protein ASPVEDRAFT_39309 [Aspergillus versicolor CBS 583.65]|uniref:Uncharacterized protein n=1 Tax=Aspergillus versicolor CBS 583.65 TaxID=1036611 RepID=A0A1L9PER1_ASPVE|nr:uncharacterized protein ASPVEDRAFT_39309 [Aspergillus versicolor CBS 583.65]OJI99935.1 hypothetical protein ASPVEDRAFT_39309 [Aspergillus versicolor CBS 583.65]
MPRRYRKNGYGLDMSALLQPFSYNGTNAKTPTMPRRHLRTGYVKQIAPQPHASKENDTKKGTNRRYGRGTDVNPMPIVSQTPSSKEVETEASTKSRKCRFYRRDKPTKQKDGSDDDNYTDSEEEIVPDLDEEALSLLPLHLQNNMREIHAERVQQWQQNNFPGEQPQHERQLCFRHRKREKPERKQKADSESDFELRGNECSKYVETWFKNMMAGVAATREQDARMLQGQNADSLGTLENMTWCPVRHTWVPAYFGQEHGENEVDDRSPGSRTRLCGIGSHQTSPMSEAETVVEKDYFRPRPNKGYMWWRCSGPFYELEAGTLQKGCQGEKQFVKKPPSLLSKAYNGARKRTQNIKQIFKK